jgi:outer membrane protein assembly factor BamB
MTASSAASLLLVLIAAWPTEDAKPGRRLLVSDDGAHRIAILAADGGIEWEAKINNLHDLHYLPDGHVLFQTSYQKLVEMDPKTNKVVWQYDAAKANGNAGKPVEVHAFQRLADGVTMIAESGPSRILEVDREGKIIRETKLKIAHSGPHRDTRLVRKLETGNYLVCQEADGMVCEYEPAPSDKIVWEYAVPMVGKPAKGGHGPEGFGNSCFAALRLPSGNTLIATGNGHSVLEVTPAKEIVWSFTQENAKDFQLAWMTTLQVLPSGNIVVGNCHAGRTDPQIIEIDRNKRVVWRFMDWKRFGGATTNSQVLDVEKSIR